MKFIIEKLEEKIKELENRKSDYFRGARDGYISSLKFIKQNCNEHGVVRPEVESAKEGELLPARDGEANTCADWKVKCHKCGNGFEKVTDLWEHLNSPCA